MACEPGNAKRGMVMPEGESPVDGPEAGTVRKRTAFV
jgi:hypothetical protein